MMRNRPEFHWLDLAAQFVRATPVSIYNSSSPEELAYLAEHSEARGRHPRGRRLPGQARRGSRPAAPLETSSSWRAGAGRRSADRRADGGEADLDELAAATEPDDLATIIYTSGTTGPPKGVMINQFNVVYTTEQLRRCMELPPEEMVGLRMVSYLPMAHIAERITSHYQGDRRLHGDHLPRSVAGGHLRPGGAPRDLLRRAPGLGEGPRRGQRRPGRRPREAAALRRGLGPGPRDQGGRTGGHRHPGAARDLGLPRRRRLLHRAPARRPRRGAGRHHRRRAHPPRSSSGSTPSASRCRRSSA